MSEVIGIAGVLIGLCVFLWPLLQKRTVLPVQQRGWKRDAYILLFIFFWFPGFLVGGTLGGAVASAFFGGVSAAILAGVILGVAGGTTITPLLFLVGAIWFSEKQST